MKLIRAKIEKQERGPWDVALVFAPLKIKSSQPCKSYKLRMSYVRDIPVDSKVVARPLG